MVIRTATISTPHPQARPQTSKNHSVPRVAKKKKCQPDETLQGHSNVPDKYVMTLRRTGHCPEWPRKDKEEEDAGVKVWSCFEIGHSMGVIHLRGIGHFGLGKWGFFGGMIF
ncbi:hypothetical protein JTE90_021458 [Oedothorax gibbosus]|uniref:Uncharacterized protein n=1 Tax=Oedothorax gibbosus TaxID=931172 RepID=A0AAV6VX46_9ARAC|nr:hypothetical protein JTE90_021458 [Oedothorax gibbosus]